jgi:hypothetical protein
VEDQGGVNAARFAESHFVNCDCSATQTRVYEFHKEKMIFTWEKEEKKELREN